MTEKSNALALAQLLMLHADTIENDSIKNMVIDSATELAVLHDEIERLKVAFEHLRTALDAPEPESKTPAWWVDGLTVTLMREGVNKHRAREIAVGYWEAYCQIPGNEEDKT